MVVSRMLAEHVGNAIYIHTYIGTPNHISFTFYICTYIHRLIGTRGALPHVRPSVRVTALLGIVFVFGPQIHA